MEHLESLRIVMETVSEATGLHVHAIWLSVYLFVKVPFVAFWWGVFNGSRPAHCHECSERDREQFARMMRAVKRGVLWTWGKVRRSKPLEATA